MDHLSDPIRLITDWPLSELIQPDHLFGPSQVGELNELTHLIKKITIYFIQT